MQRVSLYEGDVLDRLKELPDNHFDALLCDPPYGLSEHGDIAPVLASWLSGQPYKHHKKGFMGKDWDSFVPGPEVWKEVFRVLKPGAFCLVFSGTRTLDLMGLALRLAGFEVRDCVSWLYGSGFPKSHNISKALDKQAGAEREVLGIRNRSGKEAGTFGAMAGNNTITAPATPAAKQWDGYGTALKPAWEPALLVQKPLEKTFANNVVEHGCGALNIDGCRVGDETVLTRHTCSSGDDRGHWAGNKSTGAATEHTGRFPANLILDEEAAVALDATQPVSKSKKSTGTGKKLDTQEQGWGFKSMPGGFADSGGPSRFFYCAKVSPGERNAGLGGLPNKVKPGGMRTSNGDAEKGTATFDQGFQDTVVKNHHPTLKPLALTEYLAKLLLVPARDDGQPRRILVPFAGTSSEVIGCLKAGWDEVAGIEMSSDYISIGQARIQHWVEGCEVKRP